MTDFADCYTDANGCYDCPEIPSQPYVPAQYSVAKGWNAGANSIAMLDGDIHTKFNVPATPGGIVIGFKGSRDNQIDITDVEHAFFFTSSGSSGFFAVVEHGKYLNTAAYYQPTWKFEIRRVASRVFYFYNDGTIDHLVYRSSVPSYGPKVVNACLFITGDEVI